jgi:hypothetical protein
MLNRARVMLGVGRLSAKIYINMDFKEAQALGREIVEIVEAGGDRREPLEELFKRYRVADLDDSLRKKAQKCKAGTWLVLKILDQPKYSTETIAGRDVGHYGRSWETLECCGDLNILVRKYVSWRAGNSRWGIREESYSTYDLLSHDDAIEWIERLHIPPGA